MCDGSLDSRVPWRHPNVRPIAVFAVAALVGGMLRAAVGGPGVTPDEHFPRWLVFSTRVVGACTIAGSGMIVLAAALLARAGKTLCSWRPRPVPIVVAAGLAYPFIIAGATRAAGPFVAACFNMPRSEAAATIAGFAMLLLPFVLSHAVMYPSPRSRRYTLRPGTHRQFDRN